MNTYNDLMMSNNNGPPLQQDYHHPHHHQYPNNNSLDLAYNPDLFMSPASNIGPQSIQNRHMNVMQHQQPHLPPPPPPPPSFPHPQTTMHQV